MGGMFSVVKVREGILRTGDYSDPGWYENPPGTQAWEWTGALPDTAKAKDAKTTITPETTRSTADRATPSHQPNKGSAIMKTAMIALFLASSPLSPPAALASGSHAGHGEAMAVGEPGVKAEATQTIRRHHEGDGRWQDDLRAEHLQGPQRPDHRLLRSRTPASWTMNSCSIEEDKVMEHKAVMEKFPDMEHEDPNAIRLAAGKSGEIVWKFTNDGIVQDRLPRARSL